MKPTLYIYNTGCSLNALPTPVVAYLHVSTVHVPYVRRWNPVVVYLNPMHCLFPNLYIHVDVDVLHCSVPAACDGLLLRFCL